MKKFLSILLSLTMLLGITAGLNLTAYADTVGGSCGPNAYWSLNKETGEFKIYGSGDVTSRPWRGDCGLAKYIVDINISGVNNVIEYAFKGGSGDNQTRNVRTFTVGDGVKVIENDVFCGNSWLLREMSFSDSVITIEANAFNGLSHLQEVRFGSGIQKIGENAFLNVKNENIYSECPFVHYNSSKENWSKVNISSVGNDIIVNNSTPIHFNATGHSLVSTYHAATCTKGEYTDYKCTVCNYQFYNYENHFWVKDGYIGPDYTSPALGHDFSDNAQYCKRCGEKNPNYVEPTTAEPTSAPTTSSNNSNDNGTYTYTYTHYVYYNDNSTTKSASKTTSKPKSAKFKKVTGSKKAISFTWAKVSGVKGYQIQLATDKKFKKNKKTVTIKKQKTTKTTIKKLKAKKKYYVRIRTYKTVDGKKVYSSWSKAKTVKTK